MISGYASVFYRAGDPTTEYELGENFVERVMPGAFDGAMSRPDDVVGLFNHDPSMVLGRASSGTLRLSVDKVGLRYEIDEPDTQMGRDVAELQRRKDVIGSSFGFRVDDELTWRDGDWVVREIRGVTLRDVGPVTFPAYSGTENVRFVTTEGVCMAIPELVACEARDRASARLVDVQGRLTRIKLDTARHKGIITS